MHCSEEECTGVPHRVMCKLSRHYLAACLHFRCCCLTPAEHVQVLTVAKDQNGCRFLQRKFDEGGASAIAQVFPEILDNLIDLMTDPFGNYLTQKLLDRCSEEQRLQVQLFCYHPLNPLLSPLMEVHGRASCFTTHYITMSPVLEF